jgi:transcriptional regulator with XRE-family HTH domain
MDQVRSQIAARLRQAREVAGLTQGQVARKMDLHRPTISEIEAGRRRVTAEELTKFADIYEVSIGWLTSDKDIESDELNDRIMLAARQLSKMQDDDLERLMSLIRMLRQSGGKK